MATTKQTKSRASSRQRSAGEAAEGKATRSERSQAAERENVRESQARRSSGSGTRARVQREEPMSRESWAGEPAESESYRSARGQRDEAYSAPGYDQPRDWRREEEERREADWRRSDDRSRWTERDQRMSRGEREARAGGPRDWRGREGEWERTPQERGRWTDDERYSSAFRRRAPEEQERERWYGREEPRRDWRDEPLGGWREARGASGTAWRSEPGDWQRERERDRGGYRPPWRSRNAEPVREEQRRPAERYDYDERRRWEEPDYRGGEWIEENRRRREDELARGAGSRGDYGRDYDPYGEGREWDERAREYRQRYYDERREPAPRDWRR